MKLVLGLATWLAVAVPAAAERYCFEYAPKTNEVAVAVRLRSNALAQAHLTRFTGELVYDEAKPAESRVKAALDADSVEFDRVLATMVGSGPKPLSGKIRYVSHGVLEAKASFFRVKGDLTLNQITKPVELTVQKLKDEGAGPAFRAAARIDRHDFNIVADGAGLVLRDVAEIIIILRRLAPTSVKSADPCRLGL